MTDSSGVGKLLMMMGVVILAVGAWMVWGPRGFRPFHLPGDFTFGGSGWKIYLPLGTCLLLSLILSVLARLFFRK